MKLKDLLEEGIPRINSSSDTPQLDVQVLLAHILQKQRAWIISHPEYEVTEKENNQISLALQKLEAGEPLPYILGKWEFFGLEFDITKYVLIPRPETELLVEKAIDWLQALSSIRPERSRRVVDIGTGSGIIAITIAMHVPDVTILATDISSAALQVAKHNAKKFNVQDRIEFVECDLLPRSSFRIHHSAFDLICSNPPYIPTETLHQLPIFGREPTLALDGGVDGLDIYRRLFKLAPDWLAPQGMMLLEIEATLGGQTLNLARDTYPEAGIRLHQDLAGHDRLLEIMFL